MNRRGRGKHNTARSRDEANMQAAAGGADVGTGGTGVGASRGGHSTRGKKRRAALSDTDTRTVVASNPFDDDHISPAPSGPLGGAPPIAAMPYGIQSPIMHSQQHHYQYQRHPNQHQGPPMSHMMGPQGQQPLAGHPIGMAPPPHLPSLSPALPHQQLSSPPQHHFDTPPLQTNMMGPSSTPPPPPGVGSHPMYGGSFQNYSTPQRPPMMHHPHHMQMQGPQHQTAPPPPPMQMGYQQQPPGHPQQQQHMYLICAHCRQTIYQHEPRIMCRAGCDSFYHQHCSNLSELACEMLLKEPAAEWVCDRCVSSDRRIPVVRINQQVVV